MIPNKPFIAGGGNKIKPSDHRLRPRKSFDTGTAFDACTSAIINSSIAVSCGPYFDRDIMHAMDVCVQDVTLLKNPIAAKLTLPLIEAQCEAALLRNHNRPFGEAVSKALHCPNQCSGSGRCTDFNGCICNEGYFGYDASNTGI